MLYTLIMLQFTAHLLADFVFQPQRWSDHKAKKVITQQHFYHGGVVFILSYIFSLDVNFWWAAILLTFIHLLTDIAKSWLQLFNFQKEGKGNYFFTDQLIHIISFSGVAVLYHHLQGIDFLLDINLKQASVLAAFILCSKPANIIIKNIFDTFSIFYPEDAPSQIVARDEDTGETVEYEEKSLPNAGKVIGIAERFIALALILAGQYSAVGLIIAAKSILRFKDTQKNEYILVGTLLSFGLAVLAGMLVRILIFDK